MYQARKPKNRRLIDVRQVDALPAFREIERVQVLAPIDLIAMKAIGLTARKNRPKGDTDRADLHRLLLAFPKLKVEEGEVAAKLRAAGASEAALVTWRELALAEIEPDLDEGW